MTCALNLQLARALILSNGLCGSRSAVRAPWRRNVGQQRYSASDTSAQPEPPSPILIQPTIKYRPPPLTLTKMLSSFFNSKKKEKHAYLCFSSINWNGILRTNTSNFLWVIYARSTVKRTKMFCYGRKQELAVSHTHSASNHITVLNALICSMGCILNRQQ